MGYSKDDLKEMRIIYSRMLEDSSYDNLDIVIYVCLYTKYRYSAQSVESDSAIEIYLDYEDDIYISDYFSTDTLRVSFTD